MPFLGSRISFLTLGPSPHKDFHFDQTIRSWHAAGMLVNAAGLPRSLHKSTSREDFRLVASNRS
jgi:hypothetical protein